MYTSRNKSEPLVNTIRIVAVALAVVVSAMLLGASVYDSVVLAPNLQGAPASLEHARGFMHVTNPGTLFRVLSPANQLCLLLALICCWKPDRTARWSLAAALVLGIAGDIVTFQFHYPRNEILFRAPLTTPPAEFDRVAAEWATGNYVRIVMVSAAVLLAMWSLIRVARRTA